MALDSAHDAWCQARIDALQVEHQLGAWVSGAKQRLQTKDAGARRAQNPPIPVDRYGANGLEVADVEPAPEQPHIRLDQVDTDRLGSAQRRQIVTRPVGQDERALGA
ncbi:MAG TPA: hypothetical protein VFH74_02115 [Gaiellales bacterium]|nr:hypothetical protein [Gaiellales bacterium]